MISKDKLVKAVKELYRKLSPTERAIFGLYYHPLGDRNTIEEIGESLRLKYSEVSQRYETIIVRLANKLQQM